MSGPRALLIVVAFGCAVLLGLPWIIIGWYHYLDWVMAVTR